MRRLMRKSLRTSRVGREDTVALSLTPRFSEVRDHTTATPTVLTVSQRLRSSARFGITTAAVISDLFRMATNPERSQQ
jgi:hypothetical protein